MAPIIIIIIININNDEVPKDHLQATNQEILPLLNFLFIVFCPFIFFKTFILKWIWVT